MQIPFECSVASITKCSAFADVKNVPKFIEIDPTNLTVNELCPYTSSV